MPPPASSPAADFTIHPFILQFIHSCIDHRISQKYPASKLTDAYTCVITIKKVKGLNMRKLFITAGMLNIRWQPEAAPNADLFLKNQRIRRSACMLNSGHQFCDHGIGSANIKMPGEIRNMFFYKFIIDSAV